MSEPKLQGRMTAARLRWGTTPNSTGFLNSLIIKSIRRSRRGTETLIEDGDGFTDTTVDIYDGDDLEITVVDDKTVTWPANGEKASVLAPGWAAAKDVKVGNLSQTATQKAAGEATLSAKWFVNVTLT